MKNLKTKINAQSKFKESVEKTRQIILEREKKENKIETNRKICEILERLPNDNIYNKEEKYNQTLFFDFENEDDEDYNIEKHKVLNYLFKNNNLIILILSYLRLFYFDFYMFSNINNLFCFQNYYRLFCFLISCFLFKNDKIYNETLLIRKIMKILYDTNQSVHIYYFFFLNHKTCFSKIIINELLLNALMIFILGISFHFLILSFLILLIPVTLLYPKNHIWLIFNSFYGIFFSIYFFYFFKRNIIETLNLYDSFKRSYLIFENIMENNDNPIYIITKNMDILYSNNAAKDFELSIQKTSDESPSSKRRKIGYEYENQFQNIIIPSLWDLFTKLLKDVVENECVNHFYFPFAIIDGRIKTISFKEYGNCFLINGDFIKLNWYNILCTKCVWKYYECYYLSLVPSNNFLKNEIFSQKLKIVTEQFENFIDNSNKMCEIILRCEKNFLFNSSHRSRGMKKLGIYMRNNKRKDSILSYSNDLNILFPNMNYSILFFLKNQSEILLDILNTQKIYFSFLYHQQKNDFKPQKVNLINITNYWCYYFDPLLTSKNCNLNFLIKENCNIIQIEEQYLRICLFNILLFIISNLNDNGVQKSIVCSISMEKEINLHHHCINFSKSAENFLEKKSHSETKINLNGNLNCKDVNLFLQFDFSITGDVSLNYNHINHILKCDKLECDCFKADVYRQNYLDIGILTVYQIITKYYNTKFNMCSSNEGHTVFFNMTYSNQPNKLKKISTFQAQSNQIVNNNNNNNNNNNISYNLNLNEEINDEFFYYYNLEYHEILMKNIYNLIPTTPYISNVRKYSKDKNAYNNYFHLIRTDSESEKKDSSYNGTSILGYKDLLTLKNKSVNKVKSELKNLDKDIKKQSLFSSMNILNKQD